MSFGFLGRKRFEVRQSRLIARAKFLHNHFHLSWDEAWYLSKQIEEHWLKERSIGQTIR